MQKSKVKQPSETIREFLIFLDECKKEYEECSSKVWEYDRMHQDQLHDLELTHDYDERNKVATRVHKELNERRMYKDRVEMTKKIAEFCSDKQNKQFIDRLCALIKKQEEREGYVNGERHYNRRGGEINDIN